MNPNSDNKRNTMKDKELTHRFIGCVMKARL